MPRPPRSSSHDSRESRTARTKANPKRGKIKVFISYSHSDSEVAKLLDSSLSAINVKTFLDDRDIRVGDSFPEKIYEAIASSSHVLYIVSKHSVKSAWVQEELSIAKVRQKARKDFGILPVLVDKMQVPTAISHIHYADFTEWRNPSRYREAFLQLLPALGQSPRLLGRWHLDWWARNSFHLQRIQRTVSNMNYQLEAIDMAYFWGAETPRAVLKYAFRDDDPPIYETLNTLRKLLLSTTGMNDARLDALRSATEDAWNHAEFYSTHYYGGEADSWDRERNFWRALSGIEKSLYELRNEFEAILLSSVEFMEADSA